MEHGGLDGKSGVTDKLAINPEARRLVLAALFSDRGQFGIKREGNILFVDFRFLPMAYRQVLQAGRDERAQRRPFNLDPPAL